MDDPEDYPLTFVFAADAGGATALDAAPYAKPGPGDRIQFPVGLARVDAAHVLVSWGASRNAETRLTRAPLAALEALAAPL